MARSGNALPFSRIDDPRLQSLPSSGVIGRGLLHVGGHRTASVGPVGNKFSMRTPLVKTAGEGSPRSATVSARKARRGRLCRVLVPILILLATCFGTSCRQSGPVASKRYFSRGLDYFGQGKYDPASIEFRKAIQAQPKAWAPHYWLALTSLKLRRLPAAYRELNTTIELQPSLLAARLDLADLLLVGNKIHEAREEVETVLASSPNSPRAQALLAKTYFLEKDFPQAIEEYQKAEQLAPRDADVWTFSAMARMGAKQAQLAEKDFRRALELAPNDSRAYQNLANLLQITGRKDEAQSLLQSGIKLNPRSMQLQLVLADFYYRQNHIDKTDELFGQLENRPADYPQLDVTLGDFWMWRSEIARATKEYETAFKKEASLVNQKKLIGAYIDAGRWDEAERLNDQILAKNAKDLEGRFFHGALRCLRGDPAGAVPELRAVLKDEPKSAFANYYLGLALMRSGKAEEAEGAFTDCIRDDQHFLQAFQRLAEIRLGRHDWDAGLDYGKQVVSLMPRRPDGYLYEAEALLNKGETEKARQILQAVKKGAPESADVEELLAAADIKEGKIDAGVKQYEQAWAHSSDPVPRMNRFVDVLTARRQSEAAIAPLKQVIAAKPQASYWEVLARLYLVKGDLAAAQAASEEALRLDGSRWLPHSYLAEVNLRLHRPEEALRELEQVMRQQPKQIPPYILAGDVFLREGKFDQAKRYYEAARRQDPDSILAQSGLARLWAEEGNNLDEALAMIQGLQQKQPDDPYLSDTLAWIYYRKGMFSEALPLLRRCVEQQEKNAVFHFHLGMTLTKLRETDASRQELKRALDLGLDSARWETAAKDALAHSQSSG